MFRNVDVLRKIQENVKNNLNDVVLSYEDDPQNEVKTISDSPYVSINDVEAIMSKQKNTFSIMSLNIQSIRSKYDDFISFLTFLSDKKLHLDAICLQETWLSEFDDLSLVKIPGYNMIDCPRACSKHGGLIIYLKTDFSYKIDDVVRDSNLWDGLFIEVYGGNLVSNIKLGNIYRPPKHNNNNETIANFLDEIRPYIYKLAKANLNSIITGDLNLDLLKIEEREKIQSYFDLFVTQGFFPQISLPTRVSVIEKKVTKRQQRILEKSQQASLTKCSAK